ILYFFFSSRRRHTRFSRDWSSDVCSSDLSNRSRHYRGRIRPRRFFFPLPHPHPSSSSARHHSAASRGGILPGRAACAGSAEEARSEERRVGKERRSRWAPDQEREEVSEQQ